MTDRGDTAADPGGDGSVRVNRPHDAKLVEQLAAGATYHQAAAAAGCSERTARRRMADHGFRAQVQQARSGLLERSVGLLAEGAAEAAITLRALLGSKSEQVRLGAARALLDSHLRAVAAADFDRRLVALERPEGPGVTSSSEEGRATLW